MKVLFLLFYVAFVFLMLRTVYRLVNTGKSREAVVGLFMTFAIVPDFIILDAYNIPGTFVLVFLFMVALPLIGMIRDHKLKVYKSDILPAILLFVVLAYAISTKYIFGRTTDYYGTKIFGYIYTLLIPMLIIMHYKETIVKSYDIWKPILLYAIIAYAFKNYSLVGILGFRDAYLLNYEELKNVIFAAQILGLGAIICIYDLLRKYELKTLIYLGILLLQILLFESRGPILSVAIATVIIWWFRSGKEKFKRKINPRMLLGISLFVVIVIVGFKYMWDAGYLERMVLKMNMLTSGNRNEARYYLYPIAVQAIKNNFPWGVGFGNSKTAIMSINSYFNNNYPHNIVLELLLEEGVVISIPFFILFIRWFGGILAKEKYKYHTLMIFTLYVFAFINSMFSGDIVGNSQVFFFGYLVYFSKQLTKSDELNYADQKFDRRIFT